MKLDTKTDRMYRDGKKLMTYNPDDILRELRGVRESDANLYLRSLLASCIEAITKLRDERDELITELISNSGLADET